MNFNPISETVRRLNDPEYMRAYRQRQLFKLALILVMVVIIPALLIGTFALFLAIYEPAELRRSLGTPPSKNPLDDLNSSNGFKQEVALKALIKGPADRSNLEVAKQLRGQLTNPNPNLQNLALEALSHWGQPEDAELFIQRIHAGPVNLAPEFLFDSLGRLGGTSASEELASHVGNSWWRDRVTKALAQCGPAGEAALLKYVADPSAETREAACLALKPLAGAASLPALETAAQDPNPNVAKAAQGALQAAKARPSGK